MEKERERIRTALERELEVNDHITYSEFPKAWESVRNGGK